MKNSNMIWIMTLFTIAIIFSVAYNVNVVNDKYDWKYSEYQLIDTFDNVEVYYNNKDSILFRNKSSENRKMYIMDNENNRYGVSLDQFEVCSFITDNNTSSYDVFDADKYKEFKSDNSVSIDSYLKPSFLCRYDKYEDCVNKVLKELGVSDNKLTEKDINSVYEYIKSFKYDENKASYLIDNKINLSDYVIDLNNICSNKMGICLDTASLFAAVCRYKNTPCKVVVGDYNGLNHSWNEVYIVDKQEWYLADTINSNYGLVSSFDSYKSRLFQ